MAAPSVLKIAIVGCGKIADSHVAQIQRIQDCEIVAVCDSEILMARQLCERFSVKRSFDSLVSLLNETHPDVVHITTPPQSHYELAKMTLERGCHVYVEKPFTIYATEAQDLISLAINNGLKLTVGHDDQFRHAARRMRALINSGFLGGRPVHMESYYCYELGYSGYAGALLADKNHWVRALPGQLLQNVISHGIARIAEYLTGDSPRVIVHGFVSPELRARGENEIVDELRVIISDEKGATSYFTFSAQMRPSLHLFRIYGPKNGLVVDQDHETVMKLRGERYKSYAEHFVPPLLSAAAELGNVATNLKTFIARDFHMKSGMKYLIESFYKSILAGTPVPIPYREILLTARIMDAIFAQLRAQEKNANYELCG
jgi:predicted dehydrogenase